MRSPRPVNQRFELNDSWIRRDDHMDDDHPIIPRSWWLVMVGSDGAAVSNNQPGNIQPWITIIITIKTCTLIIILNNMVNKQFLVHVLKPLQTIVEQIIYNI